MTAEKKMTSLFSHKPTSVETASLLTDEKIASARSKVRSPFAREFPIDSALIAQYCTFQIIDWLSECNSGTSKATEKCETIKKIQELLMHSDAELLEEFMENVLAFGHDPTQDVRRVVVGFIEEIS